MHHIRVQVGERRRILLKLFGVILLPSREFREEGQHPAPELGGRRQRRWGNENRDSRPLPVEWKNTDPNYI